MFKKILVPSIFVLSFLMAGCQQAATNNPQGTQETTVTQAPLESSAKIFLVAVNDNGKSGKLIGCGDSLVSVDMKIAPTGSLESKISGALNGLLKIRTQNYGESGLYNALYQSSLKVESIGIGDSKATVTLIGTTQLGGTCDSPRFVEQIKQTVLQFPEIKEASIIINGKPIDEFLSQKG